MEVLGYLKDRLWSRVRRLHEKNLSMAGREVLIKAVLQSIPTYVMSYFRLPRTILDEVEKTIRRFWWGSQTTRGISWLAWSHLCKPKSEKVMAFRLGQFQLGPSNETSMEAHYIPGSTPKLDHQGSIFSFFFLQGGGVGG